MSRQTDEMPPERGDGIFHLKVDGMDLWTISDGILPGHLISLDGVADERIEAALAESGGPHPISVNMFLLRANGRLALFDGGGSDLYPPLGEFWQRLASLGVKPEEIDAVILTHMHPDHVGALADLAGVARFPKAELIVHEDDHAFWTDESNATRSVERVQKWFGTAIRTASPYRDRLRLFRDGEVFPGVTAVPLPGHSPGHCGYMIGSGADRVLIWGDVMHRQDLQARFPEGRISFDADPHQAVKTRKRLLDRLASDGERILGMHLHFPGLHRVVRRGNAYRVLPG